MEMIEQVKEIWFFLRILFIIIGIHVFFATCIHVE